MRIFFIFSAIGLMAQINVLAQGTSNFQIWTDFDPSYSLNEKWAIVGDVGYRIEPATSWQSAYVRPVIKFKPNKIVNFAAGTAYFHSWENDRFLKSEIRTFEYIVVSWPRIGGFQFNHRVALEQRWFYLAEFNLDKYVNRARYYLELKSPKFNLFKLKSPFFIMANFELLRDLNNDEIGRLADHDRYTLGLGNHISDNFRAELRVKLINLLDPITSNFIREISVLRIRFYYRFSSI